MYNLPIKICFRQIFLRTKAVRTKFFRVHPSAFEEEARVALNTEFSFIVARYAINDTTRTQVTMPRSWILYVLMKLSFKLLSSNVPSVGFSCVEVRETFAQAVHCRIYASIRQTEPRPEAI